MTLALATGFATFFEAEFETLMPPSDDVDDDTLFFVKKELKNDGKIVTNTLEISVKTYVIDFCDILAISKFLSIFWFTGAKLNEIRRESTGRLD